MQEGRVGPVGVGVVVISIVPVLGGLGHQIASGQADLWTMIRSWETELEKKEWKALVVCGGTS